MNVLLISQCNKRALTETRRILDQFAERRGERTWQTAITMDGLNTLRKLLRKSARKNTAVVCHWIRGRDHSELVWIVGDASRFNGEGTVPTNTTERDILRNQSENDWHTGEDIRLLAQMASLLHDLGKASVAFQERLKGKRKEKNLYRHEWVSLRLFLAFVGNDGDEIWLKRLAEPSKDDDKSWLDSGRYFRDGLDEDALPPFKDLPPLAAAIAWLVLTHHRVPVKPSYDIDGKQQWLGKKLSGFNTTLLPGLLESVEHDWNELRQNVDVKAIQPYWNMAGVLPVVQPKWREKASQTANRLLLLNSRTDKGDWLNNPYVMHLSRMTLMLADHHYSALPPESPKRVKGDKDYSLYANTHKDGSLKQPLDEHLLGVARLARTINRGLPGFERHLPRLARHRGLKKRSADARFRWQDKAFDSAAGLRESAADHGAFIINMASTGCGKTLANARILYALSDPQQGMRATYALGLRTLTLQTGRSYREDLHLGEDELAIKVGGSASRTLFEYYEQQAESTGSASVQALMEEDSSVLYEGQQSEHPLLSSAMHDQRICSLLSAPLLVCTVDHMTPATEAQRAGRQIAPMLRLMSSDLVLDELDDFNLDDLPALTRLVHWAGLLGSRVVLSSATLPPALVQGMFLAYRAGREHFQRNRGQHGGQTVNTDIPCLWVDEFDARTDFCVSGDTFLEAHDIFIGRRVKALERALEKDGPRRCGKLVPLDIKEKQKGAIHQAFAEKVRETILYAHEQHHETCPHTGKQVSFGLVRMANIEPLFEVAQNLFGLGAPENYRIHLCVYHARFPLLLRSTIEHRLDTTLNRRQWQAVYDRDEIRQRLEQNEEQHQIFVVLGSPVTEVGRDHDYDWAVVEPSSMRSLIQLAGRVQRHRQEPCETPNIFIFDTNLRHFSGTKGSDNLPKAAFVRPGFEDEKQLVGDNFRLTTHRLEKLLYEDEYQNITARPRIQPREKGNWNPQESLVDIEHARMDAQMLPKALPAERKRGESRSLPLNAASNWQYPQGLLTWILPQQQPFREDSGRDTELLFLPDEDEENLLAHEILKKTRQGKADIYIPAEKDRLEYLKLESGSRIEPWGEVDLLEQVRIQAEEQDKSLRWCAERYTTVTVPKSEQGWRYNPVLGVVEKK